MILTVCKGPRSTLDRGPFCRADVGVVRAGDQCFDEYRECVDRIADRGYALFPR